MALPKTLAGVAAGLIAAGLAGSAAAHAWYDYDCCSGRDCQALPDQSVDATAAGWLVKLSGEVIPYGDKRERVSPDTQFHGCQKPDGTMRCLYVPTPGM